MYFKMFHPRLAPFTFNLICGGCGSPRKVSREHVSSVWDPRRCEQLHKLRSRNLFRRFLHVNRESLNLNNQEVRVVTFRGVT